MSGGEPSSTRRCTAHSRTGLRCARPVADPRITVCHYHGGGAFDSTTGTWHRGKGSTAVTARYSQAVANLPILEEMYQRVLADPEMMETAEEIALARAYLGSLLEKGQSGVVSGEMLPSVMKALDTIDRMITRRHDRLHGAQLTITVRDWEALVIRVLDISHQYFGESPRYVPFVEALRRMNQPRSSYIEWHAKELPPLAAPSEDEDDG